MDTTEESQIYAQNNFNTLNNVNSQSNVNGPMIICLNTICIFLSIPILVTGILLATNHDRYCSSFLERPLIIIGTLLLAVSFIGLITPVFRARWLIWVHLVVLLVIVVLLFSFAAFALDVTKEGAGHQVPGRSYQEYVLADYPQWMRHRMEDSDYWQEVVRCLKASEFCGARLPYNGSEQSVYDRTPLSPVQSGCCKPPTECGFTYVSGEVWTGAQKPDADLDCRRWSNDPSKLCYQCGSCKAGVIQATKDRWHNAGVTTFVVLIIIVIMYALFGCLIFQTDQR